MPWRRVRAQESSSCATADGGCAVRQPPANPAEEIRAFLLKWHVRYRRLPCQVWACAGLCCGGCGGLLFGLHLLGWSWEIVFLDCICCSCDAYVSVCLRCELRLHGCHTTVLASVVCLNASPVGLWLLPVSFPPQTAVNFWFDPIMPPKYPPSGQISPVKFTTEFWRRDWVIYLCFWNFLRSSPKGTNSGMTFHFFS